ncbi:hypothetical protein AGMMS49587_17450 [Spirochaetia bacterium]|nr:hypothetical protein AGMMS49587_17450 [Spirochaetia bacterium]
MKKVLFLGLPVKVTFTVLLVMGLTIAGCRQPTDPPVVNVTVPDSPGGSGGSGGSGPAPTYGISLNPAGTHTFPVAGPGYGAPAAKSVIITNTGNQATGDLTAALSGADSGSFTLSKTSIPSIAAGGANTFTVVPKPGLGVTTHTATVTVTGDSIAASFDVSFTVTTAPAYGIDFDVSGAYTFPAAIAGYGTQTALSVTIANTGNRDTGNLTAALSGAGSGSFFLSKTTVTSIAVGDTGSFTVVPKTGLSAGSYTATVTISGGNGISKNFSVSFTVNPVPATYGISLDVSGTYTFPEAPSGYGTQAAKTVTLRNTGNQATGALTVGTGSSFTLSPTSVGSIAAGSASTFTVRPNTGLAAGTHTARVTVSGSNGIRASFDVSFTVNPIAITSASVGGLVVPATGAAAATVGAAITAGASTYTVQSVTVKQGAAAFTGIFAPFTAYTAEIVLKAAANYKFSGAITPGTGGVGVPAVGTIGGGDAPANTLTFTVSFPATTGGTVPAGKIITAWATDHAIDASASKATVSRTIGQEAPGNHVTITVTSGSEYAASYAWTLRGVPQTYTGEVFDFNTTWVSNGDYTIGLVITKGTGAAAVQYSKEFTITVTN